MLFRSYVPLLSIFSLLFYQQTPPPSSHSYPLHQGPGLMCLITLGKGAAWD